MKNVRIFHRIVVTAALVLVTLACGFSSSEPPGTAGPTLTASSSQPAPASIAIPSLVWLPFERSSESHDGKVITARGGQGFYEPSPVDIGIFWNYSAATGRLVYASQWWHTDTQGYNMSVSDLWVYDYTTGKAEQWLPDDVSNAAWSPIAEPGTRNQYLGVVLHGSTLALMSGPGQLTVLAEDASSRFSWSPDGESIAYMTDAGLFILTIDGGEIRPIPNSSTDGAWVGDKPVWATEQQAVIYADAPVAIAALDGSRVFTPRTLDGQSPASERAGTILWSPEKHILVFDDIGALNYTSVWIYKLSPDLETILGSASFQQEVAEPLAAWWIPGESILLRTGEIWSIAEMAVVDTIR